ncbi:hypothetical protein [uncultured Bacteroides sp.]|uniref:hypothetical protein n=1 Tax=uncultured Bacteroides sp. TaxID=162156 RepID=UPI00280BCFCA|nr:hypothetical protein [uncultured Bacteroides sp.]
MKADFSHVKVQLTFEGEPTDFDIRKELGNNIRQNTADIGLDEVARQIYFSEGEIEIPDEYVLPIIDIASKCFIVPLQQALRQLLIHENHEKN